MGNACLCIYKERGRITGKCSCVLFKWGLCLLCFSTWFSCTDGSCVLCVSVHGSALQMGPVCFSTLFSFKMGPVCCVSVHGSALKWALCVSVHSSTLKWALCVVFQYMVQPYKWVLCVVFQYTVQPYKWALCVVFQYMVQLH